MSVCGIKFKTKHEAESTRLEMIPQLKNEFKVIECTKCSKYHIERKDTRMMEANG